MYNTDKPQSEPTYSYYAEVMNADKLQDKLTISVSLNI